MFGRCCSLIGWRRSSREDPRDETEEEGELRQEVEAEVGVAGSTPQCPPASSCSAAQASLIGPAPLQLRLRLLYWYVVNKDPEVPPFMLMEPRVCCPDADSALPSSEQCMRPLLVFLRAPAAAVADCQSQLSKLQPLCNQGRQWSGK
jgi:hypothetical protein